MIQMVIKKSSDLTPQIIAALNRLKITVGNDGITLLPVFDSEQNGLRIIKNTEQITIYYSKPVFLFRSLSIIAEKFNLAEYDIYQCPHFKNNGFMVDCSRNAVPNIKTIKSLILMLALMGHNTLMLYTEDTYEINEQPYWGYMRGRYTCNDIQEIVAYADSFGIEVIPCIQTLAHLQSALRWGNYNEIIDTGDILLADEEKTYKIIEQMITSCRKCFKSSKIHIGMDEAGMIGRGAHLNRWGYENGFDIMCRHLKRVLAICKSYDFKPMMWSDMFFHLPVVGNDSQDTVSDEYIKKVPSDVDLVYWDYYAEDKTHYDDSIQKHRLFNNNTVFAGGAWKWTGYSPSLFHSMKVSKLALKSCVEQKISDVFVTTWGDNGAEASLFSVLPVVQLFAEYNFNPNITDDEFAKRFNICTSGEYEQFKHLDLPDFPCEKHEAAPFNPSKYLLFQDILCGLFDKHSNQDYEQYYAETAQILAKDACSSQEYSYIFDSLASLCKLLSLKCNIGNELISAYINADKQELNRLANEKLPAIAELANKFKETIKTQWFKENKAFGFEVQDIRIGAVATRAMSAASRINDYLSGEVGCLEELEEHRLAFDGQNGERKSIITCCNQWQYIATASIL